MNVITLGVSNNSVDTLIKTAMDFPWWLAYLIPPRLSNFPNFRYFIFLPMRFCAVWHDTVRHAASSAWQFGPSLVDFPVQGSTPVFNTKALLPASGLCLPIWAGPTSRFPRDSLIWYHRSYKKNVFFPTTALIWSTALIPNPRVLIHAGIKVKPC